MNYKAIYNNYDLKANGYFIIKIDVTSPKTNVFKYDLARSDGQIVTNQLYNERKITIEGKIDANDYDEMLAKIDTLKQKLVGIDKNLDIYLGTQQRRYVATCESFNYTTQGYFCEFEITFTANAFGKDFNATALTFGTYTSTPTTYTNTIAGSYKSKPYINLKFSSVIPYIDNAYLQFYNPDTNQRLRITRKWGFEDTVIIDGENKTVTAYPTDITAIDTCDSTTGWTVDTGETLSSESALRIEGSASFKNTMSTTKSDTFIQRLNGTSTDLSSTKGYVVVPLYIPNPATGTISSIRLRLGSDATLATNYVDYSVSTQYDGSAIQYSDWNYFKFDLSTAPTASSGATNRAAILSLQVAIVFTTTGKINGWYMDYISLNKPSIIPQSVDYEGTFPDLGIGNTALVVSDEFTKRSIVITGSYYKRYI